MRQFRGLTKGGKLVKGWYFQRGKDSYIINKEGFLHPHIAQPPLEKGPMLLCLTEEHFIEVIPESVGQSTGLKDKNGKDLNWWEGDIFKCFCTDSQLILVYEDGCYWFKTRTGHVRYKCYDVITMWSELPEKTENIHEHPEEVESK